MEHTREERITSEGTKTGDGKEEYETKNANPSPAVEIPTDTLAVREKGTKVSSKKIPMVVDITQTSKEDEVEERTENNNIGGAVVEEVTTHNPTVSDQKYQNRASRDDKFMSNTVETKFETSPEKERRITTANYTAGKRL